MVASVLNRPTLVLNRNWQPVAVSTVSRALVKVFGEAARVVDPEDYRVYDWADWAALEPEEGEPFVRTTRRLEGLGRLRVPEVVTLTEFDRVPRNAIAFSRRNLFKRDRRTCQYCGRRPDTEDLTIDHVLPRSRGGTSTWENCVLACIACNHRKADRTPAEARMTMLTEPKRPQWNPLFAVRGRRIESWRKFLSEAYWNAELEE